VDKYTCQRSLCIGCEIGLCARNDTGLAITSSSAGGFTSFSFFPVLLEQIVEGFLMMPGEIEGDHEHR
jgi:hypothetical protein